MKSFKNISHLLLLHLPGGSAILVGGFTYLIYMKKEQKNLEKKNNLTWFRTILIPNSIGCILEIEVYGDSINIIDTESGRSFCLDNENIDLLIKLIRE